ncbi:uncharacterized protein AB675_7240 [Cyphellophora attinorum]|uniref:Uncharacterized protein n=1 Tax=Cyphellophora attinorum TaxID=1664694 RepID=A0A0N1GXN3_9EURO|nr:uncharacterized protein AB675_7240 [Phialophora attinorum]KPI35070.1 hypothetical protein AB675_7240 [Phialophora attinorum]
MPRLFLVGKVGEVALSAVSSYLLPMHLTAPPSTPFNKITTSSQGRHAQVVMRT